MVVLDSSSWSDVAKAIVVAPGVGYSCATRVFRAVLLELRKLVGEDRALSDVLSDREVIGGVRAVNDKSVAERLHFLQALEDAAVALHSSDVPPTGWGFPEEYWPEVQQFMDN